MSRETHESHGSSVALYTVIALVLGVITYIEFAIVEYDVAWLSSTWILIWLGILSVAKFFLVIWVFMHLKDDETIYNGFFTSGMIIALGTFVVMVLFLFSGRAFHEANAVASENSAYTSEMLTASGEAEHADEEGGAHGGGGLSAELQERIASDGYSRSVAEVLDTPRPRDGGTVLRPPLAEYASYSVSASPATTDAADAAQDAGAGAEDATAETDAATDTADAAPAAEGGDDAGTADAAAQPADWDRALGESTYANCAACHQADGGGLAGVFPPLAGNAAELYEADGGREYLIDAVLFGVQGPITVDGTTYNGAMPAWQQFSDEQVAAVVNHIATAWGNDELIGDFEPIAAGEVAEHRGRDLSPSDVHELRPELP